MELSPSKFNLLHLKNFDIYDQLQIEESLLRLDDQNWCIINEGSPPAIVMGISGKAEQLIHLDRLESTPIIKRYSGGGTVIVDENTLFVSFICKAVLHCPKKLAQWASTIYKPVINQPGFALKEHDFVINDKKFGGNAQYLRKNRCVHHTTLLWDYCPNQMSKLKHPAKMPSYRENRIHDDFLCKLKDYLPSQQWFVQKLITSLEHLYGTNHVELSAAKHYLHKEHRKATQKLAL